MDFNSELLSKYHMLTLEGYKAMFGDTLETEIEFYQTFLLQTDHIPNKIIESLIEEMASANLVNFIEVFLRFIISVKTEYKEVLMARKSARAKIEELEGQY